MVTPALERIAELLPKCSNPDRGKPGSFCEMMRTQIKNFRNLATQFFRQHCAGNGDLGVLLGQPAWWRMASRCSSAACLITLIGTRKEND
jgi:hypothetical protein